MSNASAGVVAAPAPGSVVSLAKPPADDRKTRRGQRPSLDALTGMRFFAAGYVLLYHFTGHPAQLAAVSAPIQTFLGNGYMGVPFFFLLSGFILAYTYSSQVDTGLQLRKFWVARFSRIYPVYFLSLVVNWPFRGDISFSAMIAVLTCTQTWNPRRPYLNQLWNFPAWTLSVEALFYLCFPLLLPFLCRLAKSYQSICMIVMFGVVILFHTIVPADQLVPPQTGLAGWIPLPILRLPEFIIGILLALRFLREQRKSSAFRSWFYLIAALAMLCTLRGMWLAPLILPFAGIIYEMASGQIFLAKFLSSGAMRFLGGASYSIYLLQYPVRNWIRLAAEHAHVSNMVGALLSPVITVAVSCLVFQYWENPVRDWIKRTFAASST